MSETPIHQQGGQQGSSRQDLFQYSHVVPSSYQTQPEDAIQASPASQKQLETLQKKAALVQAAAKMAEDAASTAGKAAEMARQAAQMASRAANLPWDEASSRTGIPPFSSIAPEDTISSQSFVPSVQVQQLQHVDYPIANYQSQFPIASESSSKKKRKSRASSRNEGVSAAGTGSQAAEAIAPSFVPGPNFVHSHSLADYEMQLRVLEQANKRRMELEDEDGKTMQQLHGEHESNNGGA